MSDSEDLERPAKIARSAAYMGPSASRKSGDELPPGHSWLCGECQRGLGAEGVGCNSLPLVADASDLQNMGLPIFIPYKQVWKGTYCCCISLCNDCLEQVFSNCNGAIADLKTAEDAHKEAQAAQAEIASPSSGPAAYEDYHKAPSGVQDFPTKQHVALVRTVLVQIREAAFGIMCNWPADM